MSSHVTLEVPRRVASDFVQSPASEAHFRAEKALVGLVRHALETGAVDWGEPTRGKTRSCVVPDGYLVHLDAEEKDRLESMADGAAATNAGEFHNEDVADDVTLLRQLVVRCEEAERDAPSDPVGEFEPGDKVRHRDSPDFRSEVCVVVSREDDGSYTIVGADAGPGLPNFDPGAVAVDGVWAADFERTENQPLLSVARLAASFDAAPKGGPR